MSEPYRDPAALLARPIFLHHLPPHAKNDLQIASLYSVTSEKHQNMHIHVLGNRGHVAPSLSKVQHLKYNVKVSEFEMKFKSEHALKIQIRPSNPLI